MANQEVAEQNTCPVTGLAITREAGWTGLDLGGRYRADFFLVGDCILVSRIYGQGRPKKNVLDHYRIERTIIIRSLPPRNSPLVEIRDYTDLPLRSLRIIADCFHEEVYTTGKNVVGIIAYGVGRPFRSAAALLKKWKTKRFPVHLLPDYGASIWKAVEISDSCKHLIGKQKEPYAASELHPFNEISRYMDDLLCYIGEIDWKESGGSSSRIDFHPSHPFMPVFEAISLIKSDLDLLLKSRVQSDTELHKAHAELEKRVAERTAELKKAKEVTDASARAKSEFLANMSHEIRTPLNAIMGMTDLIMDTELSRMQRDYLNIIQSSSRSLLGLIDDILDFSKIDAGKLDFERIPFSPREVIEDVSDMFMEKAIEKKIELIVDVAPDVPKQVISDPLRLRQVLVNLLSNALKFTNSGEIYISLESRLITDEVAEFLFGVRDTGIGIDPEHSETLFSAFAQADGSTTRKYGGTGLGLAICKKIVEMMDGKIWVESKPGVGSAFYFSPRFRPVPAQKKQETIAPPSLQHLRVLLVEDNPSTMLVIKRFLDSFGFLVEMAQDAESGLELYAQSLDREPFGLIIMDVNLPGMDGIAAAKIINSDDHFIAPPIIIMSAGSREKEVKQAKEVGIDSFLMKPIKPSMLLDTIVEIFGFKPSSYDRTESIHLQPEIFHDVTILLVEDNPINQTVALQMLEHGGIRVFTADNGLEAVQMVQEKKIDAILMDVQMPEMDGIEATKKIRNELGIVDIPIIAMTAHTMYGDREKCLQAGMDDYLPKPINRNNLFATIRRNMSRLRRITEIPLTNRRFMQSKKISFALPGVDIGEGLEETEDKMDFDLQLSRDQIMHCFEKLDESLQASDPVESERMLKKIELMGFAEQQDLTIESLFDDLIRQVRGYRFEDARSSIRHIARRMKRIHQKE